MLANILIFAVMILATLALVWLASRAWRVKALVLRLAGGVLSSLLALVFLAVTGVVGVGMYKLYVPRSAPAVNVSVQGTPEQIARGQHIAQALCAGCHTDNDSLPLAGSHENMMSKVPMPLGSLYPANLTPGGEVKTWSDSDLFRALRYNIHPNGQTLLMPALGVRKMSDADTLAVIAFLRSQPAVDYIQPRPQPSILLVAMLGAGIINTTPPLNPQPQAAVAPGPTSDYGEYLVNVLSCEDCHGPNLTGGKPPAPLGPNLRMVRGWTANQFITTFTTGTDPSGHQLSSEMPWKEFSSHLSDEEITAIYQYLHTLQ